MIYELKGINSTKITLCNVNYNRHTSNSAVRSRNRLNIIANQLKILFIDLTLHNFLFHICFKRIIQYAAHLILYYR